MAVLDEDCKRKGHTLEKSVLKYLDEMIQVCERKNRRWLRMDYERAWEFAATIIYGPLPEEENNSTGQHPDSVASQLPAGIFNSLPRTKWPLRKIVKRFSRPYNTWQVDYETLECLHILRAPVGYSVPARSRRCPHCAADALTKKKKPASVQDATPKARVALAGGSPARDEGEVPASVRAHKAVGA